ncbi:class I poly(R)-hydroxyalkanoic acid synthase [Acuticoccus sp.]|uniref:class I poly(R)-hydroxyalkanoic acid synthase n=1 Tax=Acuticoccus sp. TaxID=1904378 RepID=UPI003B519089
MAARDVTDTPRDPVLNYIVDNPEEFARNITKMLAHANEAMAAYVAPMQAGEAKDTRADEITEWVRTLSRVTHYWLADPVRTLEAQSRLANAWMALYGNALCRLAGEPAEPVARPDPSDKRFADEDWTAIQFFDFLKQGYLITTRWAQSLVDEADDLDEHTRAKARFYVRQLSAALSPSNFLLTNPELLRETASRSGENLAKGMKMLAEDVAAGHGELRLRQSDPGTFKLGVNMAMTPGQVIAENAIAQLIQYDAATDDVAREPIFVVPPWINKFYILDLNAEKSLIRWLTEQGHTVFVLSWVNPDERHAGNDFITYMHEGVLWGLDHVLKAADTDRTDIVGYCVGGTLLAMTLAHMERRGDRRINTATFLTAQVDFTHAGDLKVFVDEEQLAVLERKMTAKGYLDGRSMATAFNMLRANDLIWPYVVNNYIKGRDPFPFDLLTWNSDATRMPAANHTFYLRNFYHANQFALGQLEVEGTRLSPGDIKVPVLNIATREDHIAPALSVFTGNKLFGGEARFVLTGSGHIAGVVNPPAKNKYQVWVDGDASGSLEEWVATAREVPGSWWPVWHEWLGAHRSGERVPARPPGGGHYNAIEPAPGRYVTMP